MLTPLSRITEKFKGLKAITRFLALMLLGLFVPQQLFAAGPAPVDLLSTAPFVILSGAAITSTGGGIITGNVGASPIAGSAIGVTCAQVVGTIYSVDASGPPCKVTSATLLTTAKGDLTTAYNDAAGRTPVPSGPFLNPNGGNMGGLILAPGLYKFTGTALITGADLTLNGGPNDVWIFQIASDLQLGSGIKVILSGGALAKNVFWQVGTSAVLGTFSVFKGTILADQSITINTSATLEGRALAFTGGVTFNGTAASLPAAAPTAPEIAVEQPLGIDIPDGGSKNFGSVALGNNNSLTFTIKNIGTADLTGLGITLDGADASSFTVTANPVAPVSGPAGSTTFTVRFAPSTTGLKTAAIHIANNDSDENPFDIALTGTGTPVAAPEIVVEQPLGVDIADGGSKNFGSVVVGGNNSLTFTIKNIGTADLTGLGILLDGADASQFSVTANPTAPVAGPSGTTTFTVRFAPLTGGLKTAAIHIANNDSDENPFDIALTGTGTVLPVPEIAVEQPLGTDIPDGGSKNFGPVPTGGSTTLTFTIKNTGTAPLTGLGITIDGADSSQYSVSANPIAPVAGPIGSTTFTVRFAPTTVGLKTAALHIASNDADENPFDITLTGTGTLAPVPEIVVEQPLGVNIVDGGSKDFGLVIAGSNSSLIFTIKNIGTADLTGLGITVDGINASQFTVTSNPTSPVGGPSGGTTFTVRFAPVSAGLKTAALHIASNDADENPFDITLTGTGTPLPVPEIVVEQPQGVDIADGGERNFGSVTAGGNTSRIFTIRNIGTANLTGLGITIDGANGSEFAVTTSPTSPVGGPSGGTTFTVRFAPTSPGAKTAALHIASNDADENPFDIMLNGTSTPPLSISSFSPITLNPQTGLFEQTVRIANVGSTTVTAARLLIQSLPEDVRVYNATGTNSGTPFVQHNFTLTPGDAINFVIEYYRSNRQAIPQPVFVIEDATPIVVNPEGTPIAINRNVQLTSGRFLVEFSSVTGRVYAVQYSSDMTTWKTVIPNITAPANKVQWYDDGPPKTESQPTSVGSRFYRVIEMP